MDRKTIERARSEARALRPALAMSDILALCDFAERQMELRMIPGALYAAKRLRALSESPSHET